MGLKQDDIVTDPQDLNSAEAFKDNIIKVIAAAIRVCLPAEIIDYDRDAGTCTCRIDVREQSKSGAYYELPDLFNIPVSFAEGGGYAMNLPLVKGNKGWLIVNDLDISKFKEVLSLQSPNTGRRHDLMDAWFYPTGLRQIKIAAEDAGRAVFQKLDGSVKISMGTSDIHIVGDINHDGNLTVNGNVLIDGYTDIIGNTTIGGNLEVGGTISSAISVSAPSLAAAASLKVAGLEMGSHKHGGVQTGSGTTGGPQ